jgi:tetratricopeptide (TPR) repeat protein
MTSPRPALAAALFLGTAGVFLPAVSHGFITYDDPTYVTENAHVQGGITREALRWAFRSTEASNWHPLTWISHMADCQLYGLNPSGHHLTSVLLHAANAALLFLALSRMTGAPWRSALAAALFAVHPLHVESVAWVSERKDVLCGTFWMLALWAYPSGKDSRRFPALSFAAFILGLLCKPMMVTFPFVLLLLDFWPLGRWADPAPGARRRLVLQKIPFLAASAAACLVTVLAQSKGGAVASVSEYPLGVRVANAAVSYGRYLWKALAPKGLSVFYPSTGEMPPLGHAILAAALLAALSAGAAISARRRPYLLVGWLWYLGTLVPVIGIVQVGGQAFADRYTYLPLVGVFAAASWAAGDLAARWPGGRRLVAGGCAAVLLLLAALTSRQLAFWKDGTTLFGHAIAVTGEDNWVAHANLSATYAKDSPLRAGAEYQETVRILAAVAETHDRKGMDLAKAAGSSDEAMKEFREAIQILPDLPQPHFNLGLALTKVPGRLDEAVEEFRTAVRLRPDYFEARYNLGTALLRVPGGLAEAVDNLREAVRLEPGFANAHRNLGAALASVPGSRAEAVSEFKAYARLSPGDFQAEFMLGYLLSQIEGRQPESAAAYAEAARIEPGSYQAHYNLGLLLASMPGRSADAVRELEAALRLKPDLSKARDVIDHLNRSPGGP